MATSNEKTELTIRSISVAWLVKALVVKYSPEFSDSVDWVTYFKSEGEARRQLSSQIKNKLKEVSPAFHKDLCGALNLIRIATDSRHIKSHMNRLCTGAIKRRVDREAYEGRNSGDGQLSEYINLATWFCVREEELPNEWQSIKNMALAEEQRYYNWTWFNMTSPTKTEDEEANGLRDFERELKECFKREKDGDSPVKAERLSVEKNFIRYYVSTAKDPIETYLANQPEITRGNDPTANTFLIDYYYKCDVISVADPEVFDADRVAALFVKHVFGSQITPEEPKIFMRAMRRFATREGSDEIIRKAVSKFSEIKSIRLESIVFTIAEDEDKAQARREAKAKQNEVRVANGLPMLPRLKCKVFQNDNIWDQIERSFSHLARHKALIDVWELDFDIKMYLPSKEPLLSDEYREHCCKTLSYKLKVSPKRYAYSPKWVKIDNDTHRQILQKLQAEMKFFNELASHVISDDNNEELGL